MTALALLAPKAVPKTNYVFGFMMHGNPLKTLARGSLVRSRRSRGFVWSCHSVKFETVLAPCHTNLQVCIVFPPHSRAQTLPAPGTTLRHAA